MIRTGRAPYYHDRLVSRWIYHGRVVAQGKRTRSDCPLVPAERRIYVRDGALIACHEIARARNIRLAEALTLLDSARNPRYYGNRQVF